MDSKNNIFLKVNIKSLVELNLFTESGLAKIAVGTKLEGASSSIRSDHRTYRYTNFNRGEPDFPNWNEDFTFELFDYTETLDTANENSVYVKFRIVEEGPKAILTVPYDSRSASPVYEIAPNQKKRSIIAYGRIEIPKLSSTTEDSVEIFRRIELFEVASDEMCGQLAVGIRIGVLHLDLEKDQVGNNAISIGNENNVIFQPQAVRCNADNSNNLLSVNRMYSASTVSEHACESNVVLNELDVEGVEATKAEVVKLSDNVVTTADGNLSLIAERSATASPTPSVKSVKSYSSSRSSLAEESDFEDEIELTEQMEKSSKNYLTFDTVGSSMTRSTSTSSVTNQVSGDKYSDIVGLLSLEIVAAQNLPKEKRLLRSTHYDSNPFVTISFGKKSFRTKVQRNAANPVWREKLAFSVKASEMNYQVMFSVYDYETIGYNSCLATANIRIGHFLQNPEQTLKLAVPLNPSKTAFEKDANLLVKGSFLPYEKVRKNFWTKLLKAFDLNNNGFISKLEFETMLESLGSTLSESTIAKVFEAVERTENQEIAIEEAVRELEDLTVQSNNNNTNTSKRVGVDSEEEDEEKIVILTHCPFCLRHWAKKHEEIDVITHLGICSVSDTSHMEKFVMGGFLTEEYASRKWFARLFSFMSFGNYRIGRNNGNILVQDRRTGKLIEEKMPTYIRLGIRMLHQNVVTYRTAVDFGYVRNIFQSLTIQQGKKFDHPSSVNNIPGFIKYHKIPVHEILDPLTSFKSFNEFFYRKIKLKEYRPMASPEDRFVALSPADCRLNVFSSVTEATRLWIKGINFNLSTLLKDEGLGKYFEGGSLVIARLAPQDYHRFHSPVEGVVVMNYHIPGTYYTVNPMAVRQKVDVYTENARTVTMIQSEEFGKVAFVSIGAMMVGSIVITCAIGDTLKKMDEIGYFAFGGSTVVMLFAKDANIQFDSDLLNNSKEQLETLIKVGESIGTGTEPQGVEGAVCTTPSSASFNSSAMMSSPNLVTMLYAKMATNWKDLIYREALRMTGNLRQQLLTQLTNQRLLLTKKFLTKFNEVLIEIRRPNGLIGTDSDLNTALSINFESLLSPWLEIFQCEDLTGAFIHFSLISMKAFLHSGMLTDSNSPLSREFIHDLVFSIGHSRFEPTVLENDEIIMLELIEFLGELVQISVAAIKNPNYSVEFVQNDELVGETFIFQLFDLLFVLLNQTRFSELLRARAVEMVVELCTLLFSCVSRVDLIQEDSVSDPDSRKASITFPNISKPQKPNLNLNQTTRFSSPKLLNQQSPQSQSQSQSQSQNQSQSITSESVESVVEVNMGNSVNSNENGDSAAAFAIDAPHESSVSSSSNSKPAGYNPFLDESETELAPDAIEEVMKFRAKIAGISLEETNVVEEETSAQFDNLSDRISRHSLLEIFKFLIKCIDILDMSSGKKPPGSVKAAVTADVSTKVIPSVKTQITAMKCLIGIFTDPISELSRKHSGSANISKFEDEIIELIKNDLLKQLIGILALDHSSRHLSPLTQLFLAIFTKYRPFLPAQFEYFLTVCLGLISNKGTHGYAPAAASTGNGANAMNTQNKTMQTKSIPRPALIALKTACLEMIAYFLNDSSVIAQIFIYYECSQDFPNSLELLMKGIAAGMDKSHGNEEISGEILCNFIKTIEASLSRVHFKKDVAEFKTLLNQRKVKMIFNEAAVKFNANPKEAFAFLKEKGFLSEGGSPVEIADFLRRAQGLDKKGLGEYLVKPNNIEILREFFSAFKFSDSTSIDSALRQVLESFRLPGEAQQIDRIMECFSAIFYPSAKATFSSQDACYILAFSTLMLNTDLHNPQVKHKMSLPDFIRNNRGINDGRDVDEAYLTSLYNSIKTREIVMPEEHGGEEAFSWQWNELLKRSNSIKEAVNFDELALSPYVCGIVEIVWKPIITSLIPYINQQRPTGEVISQGPIEALKGIASLFEKFKMIDALEALVGNIWSVSNLIPVFSASSGNMIPRYLARLPGFRQVLQLIVEIFKGQGDGLRGSWTNWCRLLIMLSESGLIQSDAVITQEMILFSPQGPAISVMLLMRMAHDGRQVQPVGKQSFISSLSRFFQTSNNSNNANNTNTSNNSEVVTPNSPPQQQQQQVDEIVLNAKKFVRQIPILEILTESLPKLERVALSACIESFKAHLRWNLSADANTGKRMSVASSIGLNWTEDTLILLMESFITIGLYLEPDRLRDEMLTSAFMIVTGLQEPTAPVKLSEHSIIGLGRLLLRLAECGKLTDDKFIDYLKFWCQLSPQIKGLTLEPFLAIIALILSKMESVDSKMWPSLFTILSIATKIVPTGPSPFTVKLLKLLGQRRFSDDFFSEYLDLLSSAVSDCGVGTAEQRVFDPWRGEECTREQVALEAVDVYERVNSLILKDNSMEKWNTLMIPLQGNLSRHVALHGLKSVRQRSLNILTHIIQLTPDVDGTTADCSVLIAPVLFSKVIIPLLIDLRMRPGESEEIVMRCSSLACKTFLHHLPKLGMPTAQLWKELLEALIPLVLVSVPSEGLKESVLESCKNVLLVMQSMEETKKDTEIWRVSDILLGPLVPGWRIELDMRLGLGQGQAGMVENNNSDENAYIAVSEVDRVSATGNEELLVEPREERLVESVLEPVSEPVSEAVLANEDTLASVTGNTATLIDDFNPEIITPLNISVSVEELIENENECKNESESELQSPSSEKELPISPTTSASTSSSTSNYFPFSSFDV